MLVGQLHRLAKISAKCLMKIMRGWLHLFNFLHVENSPVRKFKVPARNKSSKIHVVCVHVSFSIASLKEQLPIVMIRQAK